MPLTLGLIVKSVNCQKQQARQVIANISANPERKLCRSAEKRVAGGIVVGVIRCAYGKTGGIVASRKIVRKQLE
jgi:hypothetical protein